MKASGPVSAPPLVDVDWLAAYLGISPEVVRTNCRRLSWPHVRLGAKLIRFTPEQVAAIVTAHTHTPEVIEAEPAVDTAAISWGLVTRASSARAQKDRAAS